MTEPPRKPQERTDRGADTSPLAPSPLHDFEKDYRAMQRILELLGRVTEKDTVDDICRTIVEGVRDLMSYDRAGLFLWDGIKGQFQGTFGTGIKGETTDEHDLFWAADGWWATERIQAGEVIIEEELDQPRPGPGEEHMRAFMVVLRYGAQIHGIISVDNRISRRVITRRELEYLTLFSRIVGNAVELSRIRTELKDRNVQVQRELQLARSIQINFLPQKFPRTDVLRFARFYRTCEVLGGDLFDAFEIDADHVGFYIADVAGHGVSAALVSGLLKSAVGALRGIPDTDANGMHANLLRPGHVLEMLHEIIDREIPSDEYITMVYAVYAIGKRTLTLASAGHPPLVRYDAESGVSSKWQVANGPGIGLLDKVHYTTTAVEMRSGDRVILFTDGVLESLDRHGEEFGWDRLAAALNGGRHVDLDGSLNAVQAALEDHRGPQPQSDDVTILGVEFL